MALGRDIVDAVIREHAHRPIAGSVLLIGPQTVTLNRSEVLGLMREHGVAAANGGDPPLVAEGADAAGMSAAAFFQLLGVNELRTIDARADAANIVHDLKEPIPDRLEQCADFIIDGGVLVDIFPPATAVCNYARLLRPGGRLIAINNASGHFDPYSIPSALWYLDYFVINAFADCKVYVLVYPPDGPISAFCLDIDCLLDPAREVRTFLSPHEMAVVVFAEKGAASTVQETPTHAQRRSAAEWERYRQNLGQIKLGTRPHLVRSRGEPSDLDVRGGHLLMRADYTAVAPSPTRPARAAATDPKPRAKLKVLCVGTGRDGTQSLNHMIQHVFSGSGNRQSMHEYCCREIYQAFCDFMETGDGHHADALKCMVADCPYDSIVGNGYAAILPFFAERYGRDLKVVHLYRNDRDACIASLIKNCDLFPTAYGYYSSSPEAVIKRMAAFHFGEMSRAKWDRLPIEKKFCWYYDKTHALVKQHLTLFDDHIEIATENLNDAASRRTIADFVGGSAAAAPPKTHLNAAVIDIGSFSKQHRNKINWLMGRLNIEEMANDDVYAIDYFLDKFVAWAGYQITDVSKLDGFPPASAPEIAADLERAGRIINNRLREIDSLRQVLCSRDAKDNE